MSADELKVAIDNLIKEGYSKNIKRRIVDLYVAAFPLHDDERIKPDCDSCVRLLFSKLVYSQSIQYNNIKFNDMAKQDTSAAPNKVPTYGLKEEFKGQLINIPRLGIRKMTDDPKLLQPDGMMFTQSIALKMADDETGKRYITEVSE